MKIYNFELYINFVIVMAQKPNMIGLCCNS